MTDIVETLRQGSLSKDDYRWKAADEIEKLREQLETAYMYGHDMAKAEYRHAIQEVEGENDRLRAALERIADSTGCVDACECHMRVLNRARAVLEWK